MSKIAKTPIDIEIHNKLINKIIRIEEKFLEIETVAKTVDIWAKENDYELIPIVKILDNKIKEMAKILRESKY